MMLTTLAMSSWSSVLFRLPPLTLLTMFALQLAERAILQMHLRNGPHHMLKHAHTNASCMHLFECLTDPTHHLSLSAVGDDLYLNIRSYSSAMSFHWPSPNSCTPATPPRGAKAPEGLAEALRQPNAGQSRREA